MPFVRISNFWQWNTFSIFTELLICSTKNTHEKCTSLPRHIFPSVCPNISSKTMNEFSWNFKPWLNKIRRQIEIPVKINYIWKPIERRKNTFLHFSSDACWNIIEAKNIYNVHCENKWIQILGSIHILRNAWLYVYTKKLDFYIISS